MVSILFLLLMFMPIWSVAWVCQRLGALTEPTLRRDIAMTPQDAWDFLWGKLRMRYLIAGTPPILGGMAAGILSFLAMYRQPALDGYHPRTILYDLVLGIAIPVLAAVSVPVLIGWSCLLAASRRACLANRQLSVWKWGALSYVASYFVTFFWYVGTTYVGMMIRDSASIDLSRLFVVGVSVVSIALFSAVLRWQWKRFVSAYLDVEGGATGDRG